MRPTTRASTAAGIFSMRVSNTWPKTSTPAEPASAMTMNASATKYAPAPKSANAIPTTPSATPRAKIAGMTGARTDAPTPRIRRTAARPTKPLRRSPQLRDPIFSSTSAMIHIAPETTTRAAAPGRANSMAFMAMATAAKMTTTAPRPFANSFQDMEPRLDMACPMTASAIPTAAMPTALPSMSSGRALIATVMTRSAPATPNSPRSRSSVSMEPKLPTALLMAQRPTERATIPRLVLNMSSVGMFRMAMTSEASVTATPSRPLPSSSQLICANCFTANTSRSIETARASTLATPSDIADRGFAAATSMSIRAPTPVSPFASSFQSSVERSLAARASLNMALVMPIRAKVTKGSLTLAEAPSPNWFIATTIIAKPAPMAIIALVRAAESIDASVNAESVRIPNAPAIVSRVLARTPACMALR